MKRIVLTIALLIAAFALKASVGDVQSRTSLFRTMSSYQVLKCLRVNIRSSGLKQDQTSRFVSCEMAMRLSPQKQQ